MIRRSQKEQQGLHAERASLAKRIAQALPSRNLSARNASELEFVPETPAPTTNTVVTRLGDAAIHFATKKLREAGINGVSLYPKSVTVLDQVKGMRISEIRKATITLKSTFAASDGKRVAKKSFACNLSFSNGSYSMDSLQVGSKILAVHKDVMRQAQLDEASTEDEGSKEKAQSEDQGDHDNAHSDSEFFPAANARVKELSREEMNALGWTPGFGPGDKAWTVGTMMIIYDAETQTYNLTDSTDDHAIVCGSANSLNEAVQLAEDDIDKISREAQKKNPKDPKSKEDLGKKGEPLADFYKSESPRAAQSEPKHSLSIQRLADTDEYRVNYWIGNKRNDELSYYTNDKKDAEDTKSEMQKQCDKANSEEPTEASD